MPQTIDRIEDEVLTRYARGAEAVEANLCCPTDDYEAEYLKALPAEIVQKDYGCGNPSKWAAAGDTVVDLGSGAGKACYILSQKVGAEGRVIGVDFNDAMLDLARKYEKEMAERIGFGNVRFVKARIQDLALDLDAAQRWIEAHPIRATQDIEAYASECQRLRREAPLIADDSVDLVVSSCVLNLVKPQEKQQLFAEIFRVLRLGGRAVISDIVCDEDATPAILNDPQLWSGCISGAFREDLLPEMFEDAGFHGIEVLSRQDDPWRVIDGVEFRAMTVRAFKGKQGECLERNQAVVYKGPWRCVCDDDGHTYHRGRRIAVCDKTFRILTDPKGPYAGRFVAVEPAVAVPVEEAVPFDCATDAVREPRVTKRAGGVSVSSGGGAGGCCTPTIETEKCC